MSNSKWETIAHFAAFIALIMSGANIYLDHFYVPDILGPDLSIQGFPFISQSKQSGKHTLDYKQNKQLFYAPARSLSDYEKTS